MQHFHKLVTTFLLFQVTSDFFYCQLRTQKFRPQGRRFTVNEKVLALALYKQTGKGYRFLSKLFALPSRKTLSNLLAKLKFRPGINFHIIKHLGERVQKIPSEDRICNLIFDEMSVQAAVQYVPHADLVCGFQDMGGGDRKPVFADHALVFIARGIRKKWKQPIAYTFVESATKTVDLVRLIKLVVKALQDAGLKVVSCVCDQGTSNVAAINFLKARTREDCVKNGNECKFLGFLVGNDEIIPIFDPPHLLKCIRNNLLTKNCIFVWQGTEMMASWAHIVQFYLHDVQQDENLRSCPKLVETLVFPNKINKMKVKSAAKVLSQRLAGGMNALAGNFHFLLMN